MRKATAAEIDAARSEVDSDVIQIDDGAKAVPTNGEEGVWVAAWVWCSTELVAERGDV